MPMPLVIGAAEAGTWQAVFEKVSDTLTASNVTAVLVDAVGAAVVLVFLWWGARKASSVLKRAFMRGKLKF